jgi:hypothetical protein
MTHAQGPGYQVISSQHVRDSLLALRKTASDHGVLPQFQQALRNHYQQLSTEPLTWGDPLFHYRHLQLLQCRGGGPLLYVFYAVDETRRLVYLAEFA